MPDLNKFEALRKAGYQIATCCAICQHRNLATGALWGTCKLIPYQHLKHTGAVREASISAYGSCPKAALDPLLLTAIGAHSEFFK